MPKKYCTSVCDICATPINRSCAEIKRSKNHYCCRECMGIGYYKRVNIKCYLCGKDINRLTSELKRSKSGLHFCSSSCAATFTNKANPKRKSSWIPIKCKSCDSIIEKPRRKFCDRCSIVDWSKITLKEFMKDEPIKANRWARLRQMARKQHKNKTQECQNCGYDKYVEFCHIKAISKFDINTPVTVVNSNENIAILCPNCHIEFDRGRLKLGGPRIELGTSHL
jgi:hypothetical protein